MVHTIQIGTCISVQGLLVRMLDNGQAIISDGTRLYVGRLIAAMERRTGLQPVED